MKARCLTGLLCAGLFVLIPYLALAGPNAGGTLILHANPNLVYSSGWNYCGEAGLDSCSAAVTSVPWEAGTRTVFHVLAAFPPESSPRLKGMSFGIDYDSTKFVIETHGTCADFEVPDGAWPAPGTGVGQSWTTGTRTNPLTEAYWFVGYAYGQAEDSTSVALVRHPVQDGVFVDDAMPAAVDTIGGYGRLGFGSPGTNPCLIQGQSGDDEGGISIPSEPDGVVTTPPGGDAPPDTLNPCILPSMRIFRLTSTAPLTVYVDPSRDADIALMLVRRNIGSALTVSVAMENALTGSMIQTTQVTVPADDTPVRIPEASFYGHNLVKVTVSPPSGETCELGIGPVDAGSGTDRVYFNSDFVVLRCDPFESEGYYFWVPECATRLRIRAVEQASPPQVFPFQIVNADGTSVLTGTTGSTYELDVTGHRRGAKWRITMDPQATESLVYGKLEVSFQQAGQPSGTWWTPDYAFAQDPYPFGPVVYQFMPNELVAADDTTLTWHPRAPYSDPPAATIPDYVPIPHILGGTNRLLPFGRQEYTVTVPAGRLVQVALDTFSGSAADSVIGIWDVGNEDNGGDLGRIQTDPVLRRKFVDANPSSHEYSVRFSHQSQAMHDIHTDSPYLMVGPTQTLAFRRPHHSGSGDSNETATYWFYVPKGVESIPISFESRERCDAASKCPPGTDRHPWAYPPATVRLYDSFGAVAATVRADSTNHGRADIRFPVEAKKGQIWGLRVGLEMTSWYAASGATPTVTLGDSIPGYFAIDDPSRLRIPAVVPASSGVEVSPGVAHFAFVITPPAAEYFAGFGLGAGGVGIEGQVVSPLDMALACTPPARKERVKALFRPWSSGNIDLRLPEDLVSGRTTCYVLAPAPGITPEGQLKDWVEEPGGALGSPESFVVLKEAVPRDSCQTWTPLCSGRLFEAEQIGFPAYEATFHTADTWGETSMDRIVEFHDMLVHDQEPAMPSSGAWDQFRSEVSALRERSRVLALKIGDEMLSKPYRPELIREMAYQARVSDPVHPILMNETSSQHFLGLASDAIDIWLDDDFVRYDGFGGDTPVCDYVSKLMDVKRADRPYRATGMIQQTFMYAGSAGPLIGLPDTVMCQSIAGILLEADVITHFVRFWTLEVADHVYELHDMKSENPALWDSSYVADRSVELLTTVARWVGAGLSYDVGMGPEGTITSECQYEPVVYRYGWWDGDDGGSVGRRIVLANLDQVNEHTISLTWNQLQLGDPPDMEFEFEGRSDEVGESNVTIVAGDHIDFRVPPTGYIVARLRWWDPTAGLDGDASRGTAVAIKVVGNPSRDRGRISLTGPEGAHTTVRVFDASGRLVRTIFDGATLGVGQDVVWDRRNSQGVRMPAGVYFAQVRNDRGARSAATLILAP